MPQNEAAMIPPTTPPEVQRKRGAPKGRRVSAEALVAVRALLAGAPRRRDLLIEFLHRIQDTHGCLSTAHLAALAQEMRMAQAEVFEVASFYHHFDVVREGKDPPPALTVRVCDGLACAMSGAQELIARLPALLGTSVRVQAVPCIGRCDQAPAVQVGQFALAQASLARVTDAVTQGHTQALLPEAIDLDAYVGAGGYQILRECQAGARSLEAVIATLDEAGLRGLGGAGFPAARKWRAVLAQPQPRLLVVNLDEGEPGTFKDRVLLESDPHRFLEGALIAAWAIDAADVYLYLRDEYAGCRALLEREITALETAPPVARLPTLHLRRGAGAYICGEESALIESIEGKRGLPRLRPPYVAEVGLFGRPTLEHNLETLFWLPELLERGGKWFAGQGRRGRQGLRRFSVSGRVREPGVKLAPAGISARELIDEHCGGMAEGQTLYAYLPGGASGGILPASLADLPLDFDTLQEVDCFIGSAAVIVLSDADRAVTAARNLMRFFKHESCGQCTPCRSGTAKMLTLIEREHWDLAALADLSQVMRDASICGLGQAAPNPVASVVRFFAHEIGPTPDAAQ